MSKAKATTTSSPSLPASPDEVGGEWADLLRQLPGYDPFILAQAATEENPDGFGFDEQAAGYAIGWMQQRLKFAKGRNARKHFKLERWEQAIVANLFGWKGQNDGLRRFNEAFIYVAKKNGKTALVAALLLYVISTDALMGAELYSAASSRDQAALIFSHAAGMVRQSPPLKKKLRVYGDKGGSQMKSIVHDAEMASYKCLSADANTADGANVHFAAIDELHRHKTPELADVLQQSTGEDPEPLVIYTSTADYNRESLCNTTLQQARKVRDNPGDPAKPGYDPRFLPALYEAAKDDDWTDPEVWAKANPNLGVTVSREFLQRQVQKAQEEPSKINTVKRLHLNIITDADEAWLSMDKWDQCSTADEYAGPGEDSDPVAWREAMLEQLAGRPAIATLDLSSTDDLTCLMLLFPDDGNVAIPFFWMPRDNAHVREREHKVPYLTWADQGFIDMTEGDYVDQDFVLHRMMDVCDRFAIPEVALDRWMARQITSTCINRGIQVVEFGQGYAEMSPPAKRLETLIPAGELDHGDNPILRWMAANAMIRRDPADNIKPDKAKSADKIDGIVALVMAVGRGMHHAQQGSVYETPGQLKAWSD